MKNKKIKIVVMAPILIFVGVILAFVGALGWPIRAAMIIFFIGGGIAIVGFLGVLVLLVYAAVFVVGTLTRIFRKK